MSFAAISFLFFLGLCVGSFINVLVLRLGTGEGIVRTRSHCFACRKILKWYELIPLASFILQRGRCRGCGSRISWQYPAVEFLSGLAFLAIAAKILSNAQIQTANGQLSIGFFTPFLYLFIVFSILLAISVYDFRHKIIPNQFVYLFIVLAFFAPTLHASFTSWRITFHALSGIGAFLFFASLWLVSRGRWMGFGDAKLALGIGFLLGPPQTLLAVVLSFWLGTLVAAPLLLLKVRDRKAQIPFAPFLALGTFTSWFWGEQIIHWYLGLF